MQLALDHRYTLRFAQQTPLRSDHSGHAADAFARITIELVRSDGRLSGSAEAYLPHELNPPPDFVAAAAELGSEFLVQVCSTALSSMGFVTPETCSALNAALTQALIVDKFVVFDDKPGESDLKAMFAKALMRNIPRFVDAVFVRADPAELPFWSATIGAVLVDGIIAASAGALLPDELPSPRRPRKRRVPKGGPRLVN